MLVLPVDATDKNFTVDIDIGGSVFRFRCLYNDRAGAWYCDILNGLSLTPIFAGQRLSTGRVLMMNYVGQDKWDGAVYVLDTTGTYADPTIDNLGIDVILVYLSQAEIDAIDDLAAASTVDEFIAAVEGAQE